MIHGSNNINLHSWMKLHHCATIRLLHYNLHRQKALRHLPNDVWYERERERERERESSARICFYPSPLPPRRRFMNVHTTCLNLFHVIMELVFAKTTKLRFVLFC
jgi:hypothetical protein